MKNSLGTIGLAAACLLAAAGPASAQFWPGYGYAGYGGWGGAGAQYANRQQVAAQERQVGQIAAMGQNAMVQSGIRNTLSTQAQSRTNSIIGERQDNQNWWFQYQGQQMAQQRAQDYRPGAGQAAVAAFEPAAAAPPAVASDVIQWPTVLQEPAFAYERAQIEAPYRRHPPGLSAPAPDDYRNMVASVARMKAVLEWRLGQGSGLNTDDYQQAKAFLAKLGQEASQRAEQGGKPAGSS
ncbi:MAG: hypothetical protein ABSG86_13650 [Thermoguttaceae bacterium]|jgi:hypothetical protein